MEMQSYIMDEWVSDCLPRIEDYIRIPNLSPYFDKEVLTNGKS